MFWASVKRSLMLLAAARKSITCSAHPVIIIPTTCGTEMGTAAN